jgi:hypothetical protein
MTPSLIRTQTPKWFRIEFRKFKTLIYNNIYIYIYIYNLKVIIFINYMSLMRLNE